MPKKKVYRVHLVRTIESQVDVIADSESDAEDMCLIGIEVLENGCVSARSDMEALVVGHDVTRYNDEIDGANFTEDVTEEYEGRLDDDDDEDDDELPEEEDTNECEIDNTDENE